MYPTIIPTINPTENFSNQLTHENVNLWFNIFIGSGLVVLIVFLGCLDSQSPVLAFGFYSIDFLSDLFFNMESYSHMIDDYDNDDNERTLHGQPGNYTILFLCSITFVIVPLVCNLLQLHKMVNFYHAQKHQSGFNEALIKHKQFLWQSVNNENTAKKCG